MSTSIAKATFGRIVRTDILDSMTKEHGYKFLDDCKIVKVEDDFLKAVSMEQSKNGGTVYLYYFCNPLAEPSPNVLSSYSVGSRICRNPESNEAPWQADTGEQLQGSALKIRAAIEAIAIPFLASMTWKDFAQIRGMKLINNALAIAYAKLGRFSEIPSLMDRDLAEIESSYEGERRAELLEINRALHDLSKSPADLERKLDEWRSHNLRSL